MTTGNSPLLMERDYARLLMGMRRLVRQEFGIDIRLSSPGALDQLIAYAAQAEGLSLREMGEELRHWGTREEGVAPEKKGTCYRGVPAGTKVDGTKSERGLPETPRYYRGCRVG